MISQSKAAALAVVACLLVTALAGTPALAEISAEFDHQGNYVRMIYLTNASGQNLRIWSSLRAGRGNIHPLNPDGDVLMDSWPFYVENRFESNRPYVVWSRFNGNDYDLVWTRLTGDGEWAAVDWVEWTAHPGMDQDPFLASRPSDGRPHLVWCSDEDGVGQVYLSIFLESGWADRFLVSDPGVDSRYPVIDFLEDERIQVTYDTADGVVSRMIPIYSPYIKDDVNPKADVHKEEPDRNFKVAPTPDD
jgi:hypothetical protein